MKNWYYNQNGKATGPVQLTVMKELIENKKLAPADFVFNTEEREWRAAELFQELSPFFVLNSDKDEQKSFGFSAQTPDKKVNLEWIVLQKQNDIRGVKFVQSGPFTTETIKIKIHEGELSYQDHAWKNGFTEWTRIGEIHEFEGTAATVMQSGFKSSVKGTGYNVSDEIFRESSSDAPSDDYITEDTEDTEDLAVDTSDLRESSDTAVIGSGELIPEEVEALDLTQRISFRTSDSSDFDESNFSFDPELPIEDLNNRKESSNFSQDLNLNSIQKSEELPLVMSDDSDLNSSSATSLLASIDMPEKTKSDFSSTKLEDSQKDFSNNEVIFEADSKKSGEDRVRKTLYFRTMIYVASALAVLGLAVFCFDKFKNFKSVAGEVESVQNKGDKENDKLFKSLFSDKINAYLSAVKSRLPYFLNSSKSYLENSDASQKNAVVAISEIKDQKLASNSTLAIAAKITAETEVNNETETQNEVSIPVTVKSPTAHTVIVSPTLNKEETLEDFRDELDRVPASRVAKEKVGKISIKPMKALAFEVVSDASPGTLFRIELTGMAGEILDHPSYFLSQRKIKKAGQSLLLNFNNSNLGQGKYTLRIMADEVTALHQFQVGKFDQLFRKKMEKHIKKVSWIQQRDKKALYYGTVWVIGFLERLQAGKISKRKVYEIWKKDKKENLPKLLTQKMDRNQKEWAYSHLVIGFQDLIVKIDERMRFEQTSERKTASEDISLLMDEIRDLNRKSTQLSSFKKD